MRQRAYRKNQHDGIDRKAIAHGRMRHIKNERKNQQNHGEQERFRIARAVGIQRPEQAEHG